MTEWKIALRGFCLGLACCLVSTLPALGQNQEDEDEILSLDEFVVNTSEDVGYISNFTLSGNLTNVALEDVPAAISVMTPELLEDIGATNVTEAMEFATGVFVDRGSSAPGGTGNALVFRGIQTNWQSRDNFRWYIPSDNYNVERLEVSLGPIGQLYGESAATGVLNISTKRALENADFTRLGFLIDSEGTGRGTFDLNKTLSENAAVRVNGLLQDKRYWREPAFDKREGITLGFLYEPFERTRIHVGYEWGSITRKFTGPHSRDEYSGYTRGTGDVFNPPSGTAGLTPLTVVNGTLLDMTSVPGATFTRSDTPGSQSASFDVIPPDLITKNFQDLHNVDFWVAQVHLTQRITDDFVAQAAFNAQVQDIWHATANNWLLRDPNPQYPSPSGDGTLVDNPNYNRLFNWQRPQWEDRRNDQYQWRVQGLYSLELPFMDQDINFGNYGRRDTFNFQRIRISLDPDYAESIGRPRDLRQNEFFTVDHLVDGVPAYDSVLENVPNAVLFSRTGGPAQYVEIALDSFYVNSYGKYWEDRITTMIGWRHDRYDRQRYNLSADPDGEAFVDFNSVNQDIVVTNEAVNWGGTFEVLPWATLFYNYAESFQFAGTATGLTGELLGPRQGEGDDYGIRLKFLDGKLRASFTLYQNDYKNIRWARPGRQVVDEINMLLNPGQEVYANNRLTRDEVTEGEEIEIVAQLIDNLSLRFSYSNFDKVLSNQATELGTIIGLLQDAGFTEADYPETADRFQQLQLLAPDDDKRFNWTARYRFAEGPLAGSFIGTAGYWREGQTIVEASGNTPAIEYEDYIMLNLFGGYRTELGGIDTTFRLNIENILDENPVFGAPPSRNFLQKQRLYTFSVDMSF